MTELDLIQQELVGCTRCKLHEQRGKLVFGVGSPEARIMLVGEAPGKDEDLQGEPFVGECGRELDMLLGKAGLDRSQVYITNVVKCRPPGNRDPEPVEITACLPYLQRQIEVIRPKVLVGIGRYAAQRLSMTFGTMDSLLSMFGLSYLMADETIIPVIPIYHPSYLLRSGRGKNPKSAAIYARTIEALENAKAYQERTL
jgi:DNA polymerase